MRRIVLETAVLWRVVRRRDHDAIGQSACSSTVVVENGVRDGGRWRVLAAFRDHDLDLIGRQDFESAGERRLGERMRVHPDKERSIDALLFAVNADGLRDGEDVPFIEGAIESRSAVPGCTEGNALRRHLRIGPLRVIRRYQARYVNQFCGIGGVPGVGTDGHSNAPSLLSTSALNYDGATLESPRREIPRERYHGSMSDAARC